MRRADTITSIAFVIVGLAAIFVASGYPPEAKLIPIVVSCAIVVVAVLQLAARILLPLRPLANEDPRVAFADAPVNRREWTRAGVAALSVMTLFGLVYLTGIVMGLALYVPLALWAHARQSVPVLLSAALLSFALSYVMFVALMELPLLGGVLK